MSSELAEVPTIVFEAIDRRLRDWRKTRRYALQQNDRETEAIASACISMLLALRAEFGGQPNDNDISDVEEGMTTTPTDQ